MNVAQQSSKVNLVCIKHIQLKLEENVGYFYTPLCKNTCH